VKVLGLAFAIVASLALSRHAAADSTPGSTDGLPSTTEGIGEPIGGRQEPFGDKPIVHWESPQRFAIELKFTPYTPHIDQSKKFTSAGATPFADLFDKQNPVASNDPKACAAVGHPPPCYISGNKGKQPPYRLLSTVEFDYQILNKVWGNLGVGLTTGFYRRTTHAFELPAGGGTCTVPYCTRSGDQTGLNIIPLSALVIYRYETLANRYHVPIVPYVKAGLAYYVWWINDGGGIVSTATYPRPPATTPAKSTGYGGTFGFVLHPGIALQLDFLERAVAKTLDTETGINHTYLFCELNYANITGFGARNKLDLSDTMVNSGIGFEF
jgi:hypothetical protein